MLDPDKTYETEKQPDGSIKIVDEDGEELVIRERTEATTEQQKQIMEVPSPAQENSSPDIFPIIIIAAAVIVVGGAIVLIVLKNKK